MDAGWVEDLIALEECGSLSRAAEARGVTQPAFSRRIAAIEHGLGASLVDRTARPLRPSPALRELMPLVREIAGATRRLRLELRAREAGAALVTVAAQHSLSTTLLPALAARLGPAAGLVKLRSVNREDGLALLLAGQVEVLLCHETERQPLVRAGAELIRRTVARDRLAPVCAPGPLAELVAAGVRAPDAPRLPLVAYPPDVFLGRVLWDEAVAALPEGMGMAAVVESALAPAVLEFALRGAGLAWVPHALAREALATGRLVALDALLPAPELIVSAFRLPGETGATARRFWDALPAAAAAAAAS